MEPFKNLGMTTLAIRNTGGTDHLSMTPSTCRVSVHQMTSNARRRTITEHGHLRARVQPNDMMRNAVTWPVRSNAANRDEKLPGSRCRAQPRRSQHVAA
jgi:hypothetical protein